MFKGREKLMYNLENVFLLKLVNIVIKFNFRWHAFIPFQMGVRTSVIKSKAKSRTVRVFVSQMAYFFEKKKYQYQIHHIENANLFLYLP